jgi:hypothetical protein
MWLGEILVQIQEVKGWIQSLSKKGESGAKQSSQACLKAYIVPIPLPAKALALPLFSAAELQLPGLAAIGFPMTPTDPPRLFWA